MNETRIHELAIEMTEVIRDLDIAEVTAYLEAWMTERFAELVDGPPTRWAYEQACEALWKHRGRAGDLVERLDVATEALLDIVDQPCTCPAKGPPCDHCKARAALDILMVAKEEQPADSSYNAPLEHFKSEAGRYKLLYLGLRQQLAHLEHQAGPDSCAGFVAKHHRLAESLEPLRNDIVEAAETDTQWEAVAAAMGWMS